MINEIRIENFKKFQSASFELGRITLLTGLNGAGKSTVIQALSLIRQSIESETIGQGAVDLNGRYVQIGTGRDALCENFRNDSGSEPFIEFGLSWKEAKSTIRIEYNSDADYLKADTEGNDLNDSPLGNSEYQHIRADRIGPQVVSAHSYHQTVRQRSLGARGEYAVDRLTNSGHETISAVRRNPGAIGNSLLDQTNAWIGETCPGISLGAYQIQNTDAVRLDVGFGGTAGLNSSNRYRPTNVGFGVGYVLPIVVACLSAPKDSVVAIENPEAHLHPRGQSKMAQLCAAAALDGVQVVVESHSDHFLNGLRLAKKQAQGLNVKIHYFDNDIETGHTSISIDERGLLSHWPTGFFDESSALLSEILRP